MSRPKGSKNKKGKRFVNPKALGDFVEKNKSPITATLKVLGRVYESQGNTPEEVLNNFKTKDWLKGAGVLSVTKDGVTKEKIIAGNHIKNIFGMASGTLRDVSLKFIKQLF